MTRSSADEASKVEFCNFSERTLIQDELIGEMEYGVKSLLDMSVDGGETHIFTSRSVV